MSSGSAAGCGVHRRGTLGRGTCSVNINGNSTGRWVHDRRRVVAQTTVPNPDSISEFKIQTSQYDAMFGAMAPNTNLVTRRGENEFHGNLWEFLRNDMLNANAFLPQPHRTAEAQPEADPDSAAPRSAVLSWRNSCSSSARGRAPGRWNGLDPTSSSNLILPPLGNSSSGRAVAAQFCPPIRDGGIEFAGGKQLDCNNTGIRRPPPGSIRLRPAVAGEGRGQLVDDPRPADDSESRGWASRPTARLRRTARTTSSGTVITFSPAHTLSGRLFGATVDQLRTSVLPADIPARRWCRVGGP